MENNKQQTAVDFAFEKLANQGLLVTKDYRVLVAYREAKEMEKEQIENAYRIGSVNELTYGDNKAEQYYNETYGGNK
jgi:hypothetical protein